MCSEKVREGIVKVGCKIMNHLCMMLQSSTLQLTSQSKVFSCSQARDDSDDLSNLNRFSPS